MKTETYHLAGRLLELILKARELQSIIEKYGTCGPDDHIRCKVVIEGEGWDTEQEFPVNWLIGLLPSLKATKQILQSEFESL